MTIAAVSLALILAAAAQAARNVRDHPPVHPSQVQSAAVICRVFGTYCRQALAVSWCESRWWTHAHNGQYLGLFQMGDFARGEYGHGRGAWKQAYAARRYFVASGRDWSPWSCKP